MYIRKNNKKIGDTYYQKIFENTSAILENCI